MVVPRGVERSNPEQGKVKLDGTSRNGISNVDGIDGDFTEVGRLNMAHKKEPKV